MTRGERVQFMQLIKAHVHARTLPHIRTHRLTLYCSSLCSSLGLLLCSPHNSFRVFKPEQIFLSLMGGRKGDVTPVEGTDLYIIIVASAQELPDVEELHLADTDVPIVFFNMKLDTLRGDLGVPAFPPKDLQDR